MNNKEVVDRLNIFIKDKNIKYKQISIDLKLNISAISKIVNMDSKLTDRTILLMRYVYNINPDWLLHGTGPMYLPHKNRYTDHKQGRLNENYEYVPESGKNRILATSEDERESEEERKRKQEEDRVIEYKRKKGLYNADLEDSVMIPVVGYVTAGMPKDIYEEDRGEFPIPASLLRGKLKTNFFWLDVKGESMIDCGIYDGGRVLVEKELMVRNGDVVVVSIDGDKTTKRFYHRIAQKKVELVPCNSEYETMSYPETAVDIIGKVVFSGKLF